MVSSSNEARARVGATGSLEFGMWICVYVYVHADPESSSLDNVESDHHICDLVITVDGLTNGADGQLHSKTHPSIQIMTIYSFESTLGRLLKHDCMVSLPDSFICPACIDSGEKCSRTGLIYFTTPIMGFARCSVEE
ncbi:hypothetical protein QCA50_010849 [Cerrena zonata]|uniref:Uncharacterized protein n=1 Tax=Cerrena zonata TaxID=2478898 RepID=A0AAW0G892_9APHY